MAEWSKALVSAARRFDSVDSNLTPVGLHGYKLTVLLANNQFENNKQHTFNCIHCIGRMAEWLSPTPVMLRSYKLKALTAIKLVENNK